MTTHSGTDRVVALAAVLLVLLGPLFSVVFLAIRAKAPPSLRHLS